MSNSKTTHFKGNPAINNNLSESERRLNVVTMDVGTTTGDDWFGWDDFDYQEARIYPEEVKKVLAALKDRKSVV